ncbi:PEP-CTERM sorting domain-containing protein [Thalassotalea euphylliae]|uniref:PEP-CTERM sorting domain-containing protein n=1 Tax=Thalassotalea euphylliae TaxID=1655234 RepID=UPI0036311215
MNKLSLKLVLGLALGLASHFVSATLIYSDRGMFESELGDFLVDDFSSAGYFAGDGFDGSGFDSHTNTHISNILGETRFESTGFNDNNLIAGQRAGDAYYCAGCNGSFLLDFSDTSFGTGMGVFGVGFDIRGVSEGVFGTFAFVTFGDGSTENYFLPERVDAFWGITSELAISTIHFGLIDGAANSDNSVQRMALDNLTIGTQIPEPSSAIIALGLGLLGFKRLSRK